MNPIKSSSKATSLKQSPIKTIRKEISGRENTGLNGFAFDKEAFTNSILDGLRGQFDPKAFCSLQFAPPVAIRVSSKNN
jgi:hypothetical protein